MLSKQFLLHRLTVKYVYILIRLISLIIFNFCINFNYFFQSYTSIREADEEIAEYASAHNCFAILGQDTDYVILEGPHYYLSIAHLDLDMLTTRNYNRNILARNLNLITTQLPLFATLCGNDIISYEDLEIFHRRLPPGSRGRPPFHVLFPRVAKYVNRFPKDQNVVRYLQQISMEVFSNRKWEDKIKTSLFSYWMSECQIGTFLILNFIEEMILTIKFF